MVAMQDVKLPDLAGDAMTPRSATSNTGSNKAACVSGVSAIRT
jgi:hypothetical protein